jgi:flagellar assembly protein FliH
MSAQLAKFTFDLDMGRQQPERDRSVPESALAAMLQQARSDAYAQGFTEGERSETSASAQRLAGAAETLANNAMQMLAGLDDARKATLREGVELAGSVARKLAANLLSREPAAEIEALLTECLAALDSAPHLVIRCHPDLADNVREMAMRRIASSSFSGRLVVMGDPEQGLSDGRIEWVDGGLVRNMAAITVEIDNRIAAYLAARGATRPEEN